MSEFTGPNRHADVFLNPVYVNFRVKASGTSNGGTRSAEVYLLVQAQLDVVGEYSPISSVWEGNDGDLIEAMLRFYPSIAPEPILDATHNKGRFWKGSARDVISMDINPKFNPMILGDNRKMDGVPDASFGTVVYDPPHVGPQGRDKSSKKFDEDFGATVACGKETRLELELSLPTISGASQAGPETRGTVAGKDYGYGEQSPLKVEPLRLYANGGRGRIHCLRSDRQNTIRADGVK